MLPDYFSQVEAAQADLAEAKAVFDKKPQIDQFMEQERLSTEAQELLRQLVNLYRNHKAEFTPSIIDAIKAAKYRGGLMTKEELHNYVKHLHHEKLATIGLSSQGVRSVMKKN